MPLRSSLLSALSEERPMSAKEIVASTGLDEKRVWDGLYYWWNRGLILRSERPIFDNAEVFKGRRGMSRNTRSYYLYLKKRARSAD